MGYRVGIYLIFLFYFLKTYLTQIFVSCNICKRFISKLLYFTCVIGSHVLAIFTRSNFATLNSNLLLDISVPILKLILYLDFVKIFRQQIFIIRVKYCFCVFPVLFYQVFWFIFTFSYFINGCPKQNIEISILYTCHAWKVFL